MTSEHSLPECDSPPDYLGGDPVAFGELVMRYQDSLFAYLGRMGLSDAECQELAQEAFLRSWINRSKYDPAIAAVATWLFTITRNVALDRLTRRSISVNEDELVDQQTDLSRAANPQHQYEQHQSIDRLRQALATLSAEDREVIAACYTPEIADTSAMLNCSEGALRTRLSRARKRLATAMEKLDKPHE